MKKTAKDTKIGTEAENVSATQATDRSLVSKVGKNSGKSFKKPIFCFQEGYIEMLHIAKREGLLLSRGL